MGGKKKQKTKWRKLSIAGGEERAPEKNCADSKEDGGSRGVSWVAVPLVPLIPVVPYTAGHNGDGCYVNGLWIPNSELRRYRSSAPPPPPVGPTFPELYFVLPKAAEMTSPPASPPPDGGWVSPLYGAVTYHPVVVAPPPPLGSRYRYYRGRRKPKSFADFGTDNGHMSELSRAMNSLATRTIQSSMDEARPEILETLHRNQLSCLNTLAARLLESILKDVGAELRKVLRVEDVVDGQASKLATQIVSEAVSASARSLLEITRREEGLHLNRGPYKKSVIADIREKAHFLGVTATSPEGGEMLPADNGEHLIPVNPSGDRRMKGSKRQSEIVVHEVDDISEAGSEDVELLGHRYEVSPGRKCANNVSLAAELLRAEDSGVHSGESADEADVSEVSRRGKQWHDSHCGFSVSCT